MKPRREFKLITQKFNIPHKFSSYSWEIRESVVLREFQEFGTFVYGEVAPTPGFPRQPTLSETIKEARDWESFKKLPEESCLLPALSCMASEVWQQNENHCGNEILSAALVNESVVENNNRIIKRKIGLLPADQEIKITKDWIQQLDSNCLVRLDANGSLTMDELKLWTKEFSQEKKIQFLEQPLNDKLRKEMFAFAMYSSLPLAIDETIVAMGNPYLAREQNWNGFYVIKPTLLADWKNTIKFATENPIKTVFSTVFESPFGYEALIRASRFSNLEPGLSRKCFSQISTELDGHHQRVLRIPSATQSQLSELWAKFD